MQQLEPDADVPDDGFSTLMGSTDPALVVVTTAAAGEHAGCLVGFHSQAGITPERYCLWLSKANHTYRMSLRASHFAVHFLTRDDLGLAEHFGTISGEDTDKFADLDIDLSKDGVPLLRALPHRMLVERIAMLDDGSDHVCVTTAVRSSHPGGEFAPLRTSNATHLEPGHGSEERAIAP